MVTSPDEVVIIGAGHAGGRVAQHLRELGFAGRVTLIGAECHLPYERPPLSKEILTGKTEPSSLQFHDENFWRERQVDLRLGVEAVGVDRAGKHAILSDGTQVPYTALVVATGGNPRHLSVGVKDSRIVTLRTIGDALALKARLAPGTRIAIIGGGVIGLEVAASARQLGAEVVMLEAGDRLMARVASPFISEWLAGLHRAQGVQIELTAMVTDITPSASGALTIEASRRDESVEFQVDTVLIAIGIEPAVGFLRDAGIPIDNGVVVDAFCRSPADPTIYAVGDVAHCNHSHTGGPLRQETWRNAENQSRAVAEFLMGRTEPYVEIPWMWSDQYGINVQIVGTPGAGATSIIRGAITDGAFAVFDHAAGMVTAATLVNQGKLRRHAEQLVRERVRVDVKDIADPAADLKRLFAVRAA